MPNIEQNLDAKERMELLRKQGHSASIPQTGAKFNNTDTSLFTNKSSFGTLTKTGGATGLEASLRTSATPSSTGAKELKTPQDENSIFGGTNLKGADNASVFTAQAPKAKSTDDVLNENDWGGVGLSFSGSNNVQPQENQDTSVIGKVKNFFAGITGSDAAKKAQENQTDKQPTSNRAKLAQGRAANAEGQKAIQENERNQFRTKNLTNNQNMDTKTSELAQSQSDSKTSQLKHKGEIEDKKVVNGSKNMNLYNANLLNAKSGNVNKSKNISKSVNQASSAKTGGIAGTANASIKSDSVSPVKSDVSSDISSMKNEASSVMDQNGTDAGQISSVEKSFDGIAKSAQGNRDGSSIIEKNNANNGESANVANETSGEANRVSGQSIVSKTLADASRNAAATFTGKSKDAAKEGQQHTDSANTANTLANTAASFATTQTVNAGYKAVESKIAKGAAASERTAAKGAEVNAATMEANADALKAQAAISHNSAATMRAAAAGDKAAAASLETTGKSLIASGNSLLSNPVTASLGASMISAGEACDTTGMSQYEAASILNNNADMLDQAATQAENQAASCKTSAQTSRTEAKTLNGKAIKDDAIATQSLIDRESLLKGAAVSTATAGVQMATKEKEEKSAIESKGLSTELKSQAEKEIANYRTKLSDSMNLERKSTELKSEVEVAKNQIQINNNNNKVCASRIESSNEESKEKAERLLEQVKAGAQTNDENSESENPDSQETIKGNGANGKKSSSSQNAGTMKSGAKNVTSDDKNKISNKKDNRKTDIKTDKKLDKKDENKKDEEVKEEEKTDEMQENQENQKSQDTQKQETQENNNHSIAGANTDTTTTPSVAETNIKKLEL